jgi:hypothetical protein
MLKIFDFDGTIVLNNSTRFLLKKASINSPYFFIKFLRLILKERLFCHKTKPIEMFMLFEGLNKKFLEKMVLKSIKDLNINSSIFDKLDSDSIIISFGLVEVIEAFLIYHKKKVKKIIAYEYNYENSKIIGVNDNGLDNGKYNSRSIWKNQKFIYYTDDIIADHDMCDKSEILIKI